LPIATPFVLAPLLREVAFVVTDDDDDEDDEDDDPELIL
jgi:hypothetical protein